MDEIFEYSSPCMIYELTKQNLKEFQIKLNVTKAFSEIFYENAKKTFLEVVYCYLHTKHSNIIQSQGIDYHFDDDNVRKPHIYIHLDLNDNINQNMKIIIDDLHNEYETNWIKYRIPRLMTVIKHQMINDTNDTNFQQALKLYQDKHDFKDCNLMMHVLSNQILWYYDDISFLTKRHKHDFL